MGISVKRGFFRLLADIWLECLLNVKNVKEPWVRKGRIVKRSSSRLCINFSC